MPTDSTNKNQQEQFVLLKRITTQALDYNVILTSLITERTASFSISTVFLYRTLSPTNTVLALFLELDFMYLMMPWIKARDVQFNFSTSLATLLCAMLHHCCSMVSSDVLSCQIHA